MVTTVDDLGRVALPQEVRDDLGLVPGTALEVEESGGGILLRPVAEVSDLVSGLRYKEGVLVFSGEIEGDVADAVQRARDERMRKVAGLA
jgi:AbrB family looped-hinge helix DNA binding protein